MPLQKRKPRLYRYCKRKLRLTAMKILSAEYDLLMDRHSKSAPRNGIPVGGGDWMDSFFRMEGVRGTLGALGRGLSLCKSIDEGKVVSEISVGIWNKHREWQVHRWVKTSHSYLEQLERRIKYSYRQSRKQVA